jgi:pyruvate dehydrogenase E2 component (dihydrolipoamide acetyltransferase)
MARFEFRLPDIGEGVTEGEIVGWHVKEGDKVAEDQLMVEVMTDKATVTIGAPRGGRIEKLYADVGHIVKVGDVLVAIQTGNGTRASVPSMPAATAVGDIKDALPGTGYFGEKRATASASSASSASHAAVAAPAPAAAPVALAPAHSDHTSPTGVATFNAKPLATPATRQLARELHVDLRTVPGTGPGGRVTREDVVARSSSGTVRAPLPPVPANTNARKPAGPAAGTRVPLVGMRRRIAENMALSKNTAAHFTFVEECEADRLVALREELKPVAEARGVELTFMPFLIKAVVAALKNTPMINSSLDIEKNEIVLHDRYNIGIAAATDQGLVVPVVHNADKLSIFELATEVQRLGQKARAGQLSREDLSGSTFTITSLGKQAGLFAVPIINFPNVGILGIHRIKERPIVKNGQIAIGQIMLLSLSLDHRLVDGHVGAAFAYDVIAGLEAPARLLVD